ncbi:MAG: hypothetical protein AAF329_03465 [Cyanobacteria bacterium P01_A01_bin.17]
MIILDTHMWIWWVQGDSRLTQQHQAHIQAADVLGISLYSCWEIAKLVEYSRLVLPWAIPYQNHQKLLVKVDQYLKDWIST